MNYSYRDCLNQCVKVRIEPCCCDNRTEEEREEQCNCQCQCRRRPQTRDDDYRPGCCS